MSENLSLSLDAPTVKAEDFAGWSVSSYTIATAARDVGTKPLSVPLPPGAVLELELANGLRLLVAAEDAERYLGRAEDADGGAKTLRVGAALRPTGPQPPAGAARDGLGSWVLKALRVFDQGPAGMTALALAGSFQDAQLDQHRGLYRMSLDDWNLAPLASMPAAPEPSLLFLHGTASSCEGSFRGLWGGKDTEMDARETLRTAYGDRVYGFEHRSLTDSPVQNALELVAALPKGARLHLVSHSRGGMVGELLARASRLGAEPYSEPDIANFLAYAQRNGCEGAEADAQRLRELSRALRQKAIRVERFVRVAATARGTTLASGRLDRWASVMLNLFGGALDLVPGAMPLAKGYDLCKSFLLAVVKERTDARLLPGLAAMMPDSPLVALLNDSAVRLEFPLHVIAGDYEGDGLLSWLANWLSEAFYEGRTDLIVNTPSMSGGAQREAGIWLKEVAGPQVYHFSYFRRRESGQPLLAALAGDSAAFERLERPSQANVARSGKHAKPLDNAPLALMLPGIMGSHLAAGDEWVWLFFPGLIAGRMGRLNIDAGDVRPNGWIGLSYERFAQHLAESHEVWPHAYDWRLSMEQTAKLFGDKLDAAMAEAEKRRKPLRIVAHSMGGLLARLALKENDRWQRFKAIPGSRLVQFGTPNMGSHSIAAVLLGRDGLVQKIERFDLSNNMREFLDIVSRFPGVLELLPWPVKDGCAADGHDYFDPALWQRWWADDAENRAGRARAAGQWDTAKGAGDGWPLPEAQRLAKARDVVAAIMAAPVDAASTCYVAGRDKTPVAVRLANGQVEIQWVQEGDGRVPWQTGIPAGVRAWCVDAAHGDLLNEAGAFEEYVKLISTGECGLTRVAAQTRAGGPASFVPAPRSVLALYPTPEEITAAAVGGRPPQRRARGRRREQTTVEICHGSLACATTPVLIGAYAHDPLRGSADFLDHMLGGALAKAQAMGRYPNLPGDAAVFEPADPQAKPGGAVVVGLGAIGELTPGMLTRALTHGLAEYARVHIAGRAGATALEISCLLVGTGFGGLPVPLGMRALLDALRQANGLLGRADTGLRIARLRVFEEEESRVIAAAQALHDLAADNRYAGEIAYDNRIVAGTGGYRGRCDGGDDGGWQRVHITEGSRAGGLRFTLVSSRARNAVDDEADQRQAVAGLIRSATTTNRDQPGLSRALFELMVPNGFKAALPDLRGAILAVDAKAAVYPWELMRDEADPDAAPLAARVGLVRQLASPQGRYRVATVEDGALLVVGDTDSGYAALPGAEREGRAVARLFRDRGQEVRDLYRPGGQEVFVNLFDARYRFVHLAAHGTVAVDGKGYTGVVLGPDTFLTAAQIAKLRHVPEAVFLNCCHLGNMDADARPRWGELAAGLATQFIELGCKAVIAAGWAVDDDAAETFATTFWRAMLDGSPFGDAVRGARAATYERHRLSNTWGAYQAYGDERYRLDKRGDDNWKAPDYRHPGKAVTDLDRLQARIAAATAAQRDTYRRQLVDIENALRARYFDQGAIRERLAATWAELGDKEQAIAHYRDALAVKDGLSSLHALEQLANLEVRLGEDMVRNEALRSRGDALMAAGTARIDALLALGVTTERLSLKASSWKRRAGAMETMKAEKAQRLAALETMTSAYEQAAATALARDGELDYYPLLNAIEGAILLAAHRHGRALTEAERHWPRWLADAQANAARRQQQEPGFFHAVAAIDAQRVAALRACLADDAGASLTDAALRERLVDGYREAFKRLGTARENDSVVEHIGWLARMWPTGEKQRAVREALDDLYNRLQHLA